MTPDQLRAKATQKDQEAYDSFERCDADGFMSQWASGLSAQQLRLEAEIQEDGGRATFPALFDLNGNLVAAKYVDTRHGYAWGILASDDPSDRFVSWFNPSAASDAKRARRNDSIKGYYVGYVKAPAKAELRGGNAATVMAMPVRTDGGFSRDVVIIDNGHGETNLERWYDA